MSPANPETERLRLAIEESRQRFLQSGGKVERLNWAGEPVDVDPHFPEVELAVPVQCDMAREGRKRKPRAAAKAVPKPAPRGKAAPRTIGDVLSHIEGLSYAKFARRATSIQRRAERLRAEIEEYAKELRRRAQASAKVDR